MILKASIFHVFMHLKPGLQGCKNCKLVDIWILVWQILTSQILLNKSLLVQQGADDATAQEIPFPYKILADFVSANYQRV